MDPVNHPHPLLLILESVLFALMAAWLLTWLVS